jgi:hypothetical protein
MMTAMLTKEDRQFITTTVAGAIDQAFIQRTANFATKDDLKKFTTKDDLAGVEKSIKGIRKDLAGFATKDDLADMEKGIRKDLAGFATKDDLAAMNSGIRKDLAGFATKDDLASTEERIKDDLGKKIHNEVEGLAILTQGEFETVHDSFVAVNRKLDDVAATTREHGYYIRKFSADIDQLKQRTGLTD